MRTLHMFMCCDRRHFEITQDVLRVDETHQFNMFLLNIHWFKFWKLKNPKIMLFSSGLNH